MLDRTTYLILEYAGWAVIVLCIAVFIGGIPQTLNNLLLGIVIAGAVGLIGGGVQAGFELFGRNSPSGK